MRARRSGSALLLLAVLAGPLVAQLPLTASGTLRLRNLSRPDAGPFTPDPLAPPAFLYALGHVGTSYPVSYPAVPEHYNDIEGLEARIQGASATTTLVGAPAVFYVTSETPWTPAGPDTVSKSLSGAFVFVAGAWAAPSGSIRGAFSLTIVSFPGNDVTRGTATGSLTFDTATGALALGATGRSHVLGPPAWVSPAWLDDFTGPPANAGGDVVFLEMSPADLFADPVVMASGPGATHVATADLDLDGDVDLVVAHRFGDSAGIHINTGTGAFLPAVIVPTGPEPVRVAVSTVNGDLLPDIVVLCRGDGTLRVHPGLGGGSFGAAAVTFVGTEPADIIASDASGDGQAEIVTCVAGGVFGGASATLLLNDGTGGLITYLTFPGLLRAGGIAFAPVPTSPTIPDVAVTDPGDLLSPADDFVRLYKVTAGGPVLVQSLSTAPEPGAVELADLDGDRVRDVVVTTLGSFLGPGGSVEFFRGLPSGSSWDPPVSIASGGWPASVRVADITRDGRNDLVVGRQTAGDVAVLRDWDAGAFTGSVAVPIGAGQSFALPADLNQDGFPDIVATPPSTGAVVVALAIPRSRVEAYGAPCVGAAGDAPVITTSGFLNLGHPTFRIHLGGALPGRLAVLILTLKAGALPIGGPGACSAWLDLLPDSLLTSLDPAGGWYSIPGPSGHVVREFNLPPASIASFAQGIAIHASWACEDPFGGMCSLSGFCFRVTGAVRMTIF